ncbi:AAA family ATPase [Chitinophagales bacterium]|nr:AAA family ATPase [Chitinophagales bacterium]
MENSSIDIRELTEKIERESGFIDLINMEISKSIVGQKKMVDRLVLAMLANGHILLEGVPGLAKTLAIKSLSSAVEGAFSRIQFTPDLLPADILGTMIYNQKENDFSIKKGPVFANFVLADEINRAPAKVQSALLEAMQEKQVTIGDTSFKLDEPFLVLATQNPIEQEGTYPLPEAQIDRFMLKVNITYPEKEEERQIIRMNIGNTKPTINPVVSLKSILKGRELVKDVYMDEKIEQYILDIVFATRNPEGSNLKKIAPLITYGGSPRASINLALASKAMAFMKKRAYVIPEDVKTVCHDVMRHRIGLSYEAEAENVSADELVSEVLNAVEIP